jgi:hypothetical protein
MKLKLLLFVLLFSVSFVFAANGWGDINTGGGADDDVPVGNGFDDAEVAPAVYSDEGSSVAGTKYTRDFYIALGVAGVGLLIAVLFAYLFLKKPKNRWKKPKQKVVKG